VETISSRHNSVVRRYRRLVRDRDPGDRLVLLDGRRLVEDALAAGVPILDAAFSSAALGDEDQRRLAARLEQEGAQVHAVHQQVLEAISPVSTPGGVLAITRVPGWSVDDLFGRRPPLVVVGAGIQEPGNVGAILRAAEAGGASGVAFCGASADPFGWKAVRGSMGSALRVPVVAAGEAVLLDAARRHGAALLAAAPKGGRALFDADLRGPVVLIVGNEGGGIPAGLIQAADATVSIPMRPPVESLNVAVAAALLVYEAYRQRTGSQ
jgi:TrmH family RNA methyltransferase